MFNKGECCKYFYYKVKNNITDTFDLNCGDTNDCQEKLREHILKNFDASISDVCINSSINVDKNTINIFDNLDELVSSSNKIYYGHKNYSDLQALIGRMKFVEGSKFNNRECIRLLLKKYYGYYKNYVKTELKDKAINSYLTYNDKCINGILNVVSGTNGNIQEAEGQTYFAEVREAHTDFASGTGTCIGFSSFANLEIAFILHKVIKEIHLINLCCIIIYLINNLEILI
ncbi:hypothetical protein PGO_001065 [Plasmodium gonderi]|uniref:Variable surface protein n=1 Tax=Plasmodium gonderi TaxID=77519 RepID=A0A1Y1JND0_PLAGO|nr:hypothetical protein PGO_001065 [Plasmodium gonderi]GAW84096.1 hypothetical protein PGO_001065 [Plasmodium gonderi]